ncbi:MAG: ABC transporter substrate-binding protein [Clostridia bacterium]|nr:ABC transporter substrate-binding protein [Clostridia bacterium]
MKRLLFLLLALTLLWSAASAEAACPQRVVSLYGSFAEAWLQAGGSLVGVTEDAVSERQLALADGVAIIGTNKAPNLELILALDPDWVILSADIAAQLEAQELLTQAGIPATAYQVDTYQDYLKMMDDFTRLTGRRDLYEKLVPPMVQSIEETIAKASQMPSPRVLLIRAYSSGAKAKAADNLAGVILQDLHTDNIAARQKSLLEELTLEAIVAEDPQFIFITIMGQDAQAALDALNASLGQNPAWQALTAVQNSQVHLLPKELFHYKPNARWGESYAYLFNLLYGSQEP